MQQQLDFILVPHTHWDREWYLTFQQFRIKLVRTIDQVLDILDQDPDFTYFMLDGQTIVLEDYLEVSPEQAERLQRHARSGRLLTGPWYLQPDEFLVSGESLIRNLMTGFRMAADYGGAMPIGYVPDTFGHIAQLPQILRGFGLDNAVFWRGVGEEARQSEFRWRAPDGSEVLVAHLADPRGYSNACRLPLDVDAFLQRLEIMKAALLPRATTNTLLLMNGADHLPPQAGLPAVIAAANVQLTGMRVRIGTLPQYLDALRAAPGARQVLAGEMRSSQRAHLLPGVLSTRMWIKQQNAASEHLLTGWAEPACAWAWTLGAAYPAGLLRRAWKFLMHNHPHDSICGCSIDQVHREMAPRFAQSDQIAAELTIEALQAAAAQIATRALIAPAPAAAPADTAMADAADEDGTPRAPSTAPAAVSSADALGTSAQDTVSRPSIVGGAGEGQPDARAVAAMLFAPVTSLVPAPDGTLRAPMPVTEQGVALIVFNQASGPRTDMATATVQLLPGLDEVEVVDDAGNLVPTHEVSREVNDWGAMTVDKGFVAGAMAIIAHGTGIPEAEDPSSGRMQGHARRRFPSATSNTPRDLAYGRIRGQAIIDVAITTGAQPGVPRLAILLAGLAQPNLPAIQSAEQELNALLARPDVTGFEVLLREAPRLTLAFPARDLPAHGYRSYLLRARRQSRGGEKISPQRTQRDAEDSGLLGPKGPEYRTGPEGLTGDAPHAHHRLPLPASGRGSGGEVPPADLAEERMIENEWFRVTADAATGTLTALDKRTGTTYTGLNQFVDGGDVGDLYTYCPPLHDTLVSAPADPPEIAVVERNDVRAILRVRQVYALPAHCSADRQARADVTVPCAITSEVTIAAGVGVITIRTEVDNQARDHRLRVHFSVPIQTDHAVAEGTFMVHRRPISAPRPPGAHPYAGWAEEPVNTQPHKRFVDISDGRVGLAALDKGLPEYEALSRPETGETAIALTLLRGIEWLSRGDLHTRRGHAGPAQQTPEAQCLGQHVFEYALVPHPGDWTWDDAAVQRLAAAFNLPLCTITTALHDGTLPAIASFVTLLPRTLMISAIKRAEREEALIVRCYNPLPSAQQAELSVSMPFREALLVNLNEEPLAEAPGGASSTRELTWDPAGDGARHVSFSMPPYSIRTILFGPLPDAADRNG
jgi:alpha-mannosidase